MGTDPSARHRNGSFVWKEKKPKSNKELFSLLFMNRHKNGLCASYSVILFVE
jgi:hypothetical protein